MIVRALGMSLVLVALVLPPATAGAQCRPGEHSNEAKLLAHYSAPIAFAPQTGPAFARDRLVLGGDFTYIPKPDPAVESTGTCFNGKKSTQLSPVFPRARLTIGLPSGIGLEVGYLPPARVAGAKANLVSGAVSVARPFLSVGGQPITAAARVHATRGYVNGAITCNDDALQQSNPSGPCYGSKESNDTFRPNMWGIDGAVGRSFLDRRLDLYAGGGMTWLSPRFRVGFTDATGYHDRTRVEVDLHRLSAFGGATYHLAGIWSGTAQVYSFPEDVTLFRVGATARLGRL